MSFRLISLDDTDGNLGSPHREFTLPIRDEWLGANQQNAADFTSEEPWEYKNVDGVLTPFLNDREPIKDSFIVSPM